MNFFYFHTYLLIILRHLNVGIKISSGIEGKKKKNNSKMQQIFFDVPTVHILSFIFCLFLARVLWHMVSNSVIIRSTFLFISVFN